MDSVLSLLPFEQKEPPVAVHKASLLDTLEGQEKAHTGSSLLASLLSLLFHTALIALFCSLPSMAGLQLPSQPSVEFLLIEGAGVKGDGGEQQEGSPVAKAQESAPAPAKLQEPQQKASPAPKAVSPKSLPAPKPKAKAAPRKLTPKAPQDARPARSPEPHKRTAEALASTPSKLAGAGGTQLSPGTGAGQGSEGKGRGSSGQGADARSSGGTSSDLAQAKAEYFAKHYEYIRKRVRRHLVYSENAKRMGMQGVVTVSFTLRKDGSASNIALRKSSGYPLLDSSALEAVRTASPFPPPPAEAKIALPVQFSLR